MGGKTNKDLVSDLHARFDLDWVTFQVEHPELYKTMAAAYVTEGTARAVAYHFYQDGALARQRMTKEELNDE